MDHVVEHLTETLLLQSAGALPLPELARAVESRHGIRVSESRIRDLASRFDDQIFLLESKTVGKTAGVSRRDEATLGGIFEEQTGPWVVVRSPVSQGGSGPRPEVDRFLSKIRDCVVALAEETDTSSQASLSRWLLLVLESRSIFSRILQDSGESQFLNGDS